MRFMLACPNMLIFDWKSIIQEKIDIPKPLNPGICFSLNLTIRTWKHGKEKSTLNLQQAKKY